MSIRVLAAVAALALATTASAQSRPRPDEPTVKTVPPAPVSAYEGYRPFREEEMVPWHEVNDKVRRLGGHTGHMKDETSSPAASITSAPAVGEPQAPERLRPGGHKDAH